jgi:dCTP deaminase
MAFWSSQKLETNLAKLVDKPDRNLVDCNAVTLRVGREIYITPGLEQPAPNSHTKQLLDNSAPFTVPPGQFAFLLTEEVVTIPPEVMGFISIKATFKSKGLVNVSGFHVDPGWTGPLIFSVFNAGPAAVHLQRGMPLFLLWIADLDEASKKRKTTPGPAGIPPTMINNITGVVDSLYALENRTRDELKKLSDKDTELSNRMHAMDKTWHRVLLGFGIAGGILLIATGVLVREAIMSVISPHFVSTTAQPKPGPTPQTSPPPNPAPPHG